jgi:proton glutamate symport protein
MSANRSLNRWSLLALFLGILNGLFFGHLLTDFIQPLGQAFSMLVQMAVYPYICLSLICGVSRTNTKDFLTILKKGILFTGGAWFLVLFFTYFLSQLIPTPLPPLFVIGDNPNDHGAMLQIIESLIPTNGIDELANNGIGFGFAISLLVGIALMNTQKKEVLIPYLKNSLFIIEKIFWFLRIISPVAVFLFISVAIGRIRMRDFLETQFPSFSMISLSIFIVFIVVPLIFTLCTKIKIREVFGYFRDICFIPFLAGSFSLMIPFLSNYIKEERLKGRESDLQIIVPFGYSLGQIGSAVVLFISSYFAFFYRLSLSFLEKIYMTIIYAPILLTDITSSLKSTFLIKEINLPEHAIVTEKETALGVHYFLVLISLASVLSLILLIHSSYLKKLNIQWKKFIFSMSVLVLLFIVNITFIKERIHVHDYYLGLYQNLKLSAVLKNPVPAKVLPRGEFGAARDPQKPTLLQILQTGVIKIAIEFNEVPYSYLNDNNELVGYDVAYAYQLAKDLGVSIEFFQSDVYQIDEQINTGIIDLAMASFIVSEERLKTMDYSHPYHVDANVLIVPRAKIDSFKNLESLEKKKLKILSGGAYIPITKRHFPNATIHAAYHNLQPLIDGEVDACLWNRNAGVVWCLLNPEFIALDYGAPLGRTYFAYPFREGDEGFASFLNNWLRIKDQSGFKQEMINYWIDGQPPIKSPHFSILENVFHVQNFGS